MPTQISAEKPGGIAALYRDFWHYAAGGRGAIAAAFALLLASQGFKLAVPWLTGRALNTLQLQGLAGLHSAGLWLA